MKTIEVIEKIKEKIQDTTKFIKANVVFNMLIQTLCVVVQVCSMATAIVGGSTTIRVVNGAVFIIMTYLYYRTVQNALNVVEWRGQALERFVDVAFHHAEKTIDEILEEESNHIPKIEEEEVDVDSNAGEKEDS